MLDEYAGQGVGNSAVLAIALDLLFSLRELYGVEVEPEEMWSHARGVLYRVLSGEMEVPQQPAGQGGAVIVDSRESNDLKRTELDLRRREIELREKELSAQKDLIAALKQMRFSAGTGVLPEQQDNIDDLKAFFNAGQREGQ